MGMYLEVEGNKAETLRNLGCEDVTLIAELSSGMESFKTANKLLVCVVDNGGWQAAALCLNNHEYARFNQASDPRPKTWFLVEKDLARLYFVNKELFDKLCVEGIKMETPKGVPPDYVYDPLDTWQCRSADRSINDEFETIWSKPSFNPLFEYRLHPHNNEMKAHKKGAIIETLHHNNANAFWCKVEKPSWTEGALYRVYQAKGN